jgi:hypothetical protein
MRRRIAFAIAFSLLAGASGRAGASGKDKKARQEIEVKAVSYRAFPHENINAAFFPTCYGAGGESSFWATMRMTCQNMTTPPPAVSPGNFHFIEVYNLVQAGGSIYAITCQAKWIDGDCVWLTPGSTFQAEVQDWTMWVSTPRSGGHSDKQIRRKFRLLEVQPAAAVPDSKSATPPAQGVSAPVDAIQPGSYFGVVRSAPPGVAVRFGISIRDEGGSLNGCISIHPPLYGSGAISGTVKGTDISFDAVGPNYLLKFRGELQGSDLRGTYAVAPDDDDGAFILRRLSPDAPTAGVETKECLKALISLDPPGPFSQ